MGCQGCKWVDGFSVSSKLRFLNKQTQVWHKEVFGSLSKKKHLLLFEISYIGRAEDGNSEEEDWNRRLTIQKKI